MNLYQENIKGQTKDYNQNFKVNLNELFNILDIDKNGELSRSELHESAQRMGWHWHEAPIFAVLDHLAVLKPISKKNFMAYMTQIIEDPHGPYGKVLLNSPHFLHSTASITSPNSLKQFPAQNLIISEARLKSICFKVLDGNKRGNWGLPGNLECS